MNSNPTGNFEDNRDIFAAFREMGVIEDGRIPIELGSAYEITRDSWQFALSQGGPFGIADALGTPVTLSALSSHFFAPTLVSAWIAGTTLALAEKPEETQDTVLRGNIKIANTSGKVVAARDLNAVERWIVDCFRSYKQTGDINSALSSVDSSIRDHLEEFDMLGNLDDMVGLAAATLLVAAHAAFPGSPPQEIRIQAEGVIVINGNIGDGNVIGSDISSNSGNVGGMNNTADSSHVTPNAGNEAATGKSGTDWTKVGAVVGIIAVLVAIIIGVLTLM